jgi:hypothetical protein
MPPNLSRYLGWMGLKSLRWPFSASNKPAMIGAERLFSTAVDTGQSQHDLLYYSILDGAKSWGWLRLSDFKPHAYLFCQGRNICSWSEDKALRGDFTEIMLCFGTFAAVFGGLCCLLEAFALRDPFLCASPKTPSDHARLRHEGTGDKQV